MDEREEKVEREEKDEMGKKGEREGIGGHSVHQCSRPCANRAGAAGTRSTMHQRLRPSMSGAGAQRKRPITHHDRGRNAEAVHGGSRPEKSGSGRGQMQDRAEGLAAHVGGSTE
jgi:hypothetical protein